jgi:hypothetical protein
VYTFIGKRSVIKQCSLEEFLQIVHPEEYEFVKNEFQKLIKNQNDKIDFSFNITSGPLKILKGL